ncbi:MAG: anti-sigma factor [Vicinamibacteria bacterium]
MSSCAAPEREILVFLAAGSLDPQQRAAAAAHLEGCPECRREWPALRELVDGLRDLHLTSEEVVTAAATGRHADHVALCARCREEVESLRLVARDLGGSRRFAPRTWPVAAALAVGIATGLLLRLALLPPAPPPAVPSRAAADVRRIAELEGRLNAPERLRLNVPLVELQPDPLRGRGADAVSLRREQGRALLVLASLDERRFDDYIVEVVAPAGSLLFRSGGLARTAHGTFSLELPLSQLEPGPHEILLLGVSAGREHRLERFRIRIE